MKKSIMVLIALLWAVICNAQKQPQVQKVSVRAPANIKIDGQLKEWVNKNLEAFNSSTRLYYVISNDDDNLYLTMRGLGPLVVEKSLQEGIVFTICHSAKYRAKAADNMSITFPVPQNNQTVSTIVGPLFGLGNLLKDTVANHKKIDSIVSIANRRIDNAMKLIGLSGIKEIPDSVISVYNITGIKAAAQLIRMQPVIEIAIPLKYLGLAVNGQMNFSYNVRINGQPLKLVVNPDLEKKVDTSNPDQMYDIATVDFSGVYTLTLSK